MIKEEYPYIDEKGVVHENLVKYYSDNNLIIRQVETGDEYETAIDFYPSKYTYEETDYEINFENSQETEPNDRED